MVKTEFKDVFQGQGMQGSVYTRTKVFTYNQEGQVLDEKEYVKGVLSGHIINYYDDGLLRKKTRHNYAYENTTIHIFYYYDHANRIHLRKQVFGNRVVSYGGEKNFEFNSRGQITYFERWGKDETRPYETYEISFNNHGDTLSYQKSGYSQSVGEFVWFRNEYEYDNKGRLKEIRYFDGPGLPENFSHGFKNFKYNSNDLEISRKIYRISTEGDTIVYNITYAHDYICF